MKKVLVLIIIILVIIIVSILNTTYTYTSYDKNGNLITTYQKIGDYLLGRD